MKKSLWVVTNALMAAIASQRTRPDCSVEAPIESLRVRNMTPQEALKTVRGIQDEMLRAGRLSIAEIVTTPERFMALEMVLSDYDSYHHHELPVRIGGNGVPVASCLICGVKKPLSTWVSGTRHGVCQECRSAADKAAAPEQAASTRRSNAPK